MKLIATIHPKDVGLNDVPVDVTYRERRAARAVLRDDSGRIALIHGAAEQYYKLPGGGIEDGEDIAKALEREVIEEVGTKCTTDMELGSTEEWRVDESGALHQVSYAYLAKTVGPIGTPAFTDGELAEGFSVEWIDTLDEAVSLVRTIPYDSSTRVKFMTMRDAAILEAVKPLL